MVDRYYIYNPEHDRFIVYDGIKDFYYWGHSAEQYTVHEMGNALWSIDSTSSAVVVPTMIVDGVYQPDYANSVPAANFLDVDCGQLN